MEFKKPVEVSIFSFAKLIVKEHRHRLKCNSRYKKGLKKFEKLSKAKNIKLDLGSGISSRPGHVGVDRSDKAELSWDLSWGLPLPNDSVEEIRSDHFFEHLELDLAFKVFMECHRVLVPGGILDFTIPHLNPYLDAYSENNVDFLADKIHDIPKKHKELYQTAWDYISWLLLRNGQHRAIYDKESIIHKIRTAGFKSVDVREFDSNRDINFRFSSIYIKAIK